MGREVCRAVDAADDLSLVAAVDPHHEGAELGNLVLAGSPEALEGVDVAVDFTTPGSVIENARWCLGRGMHMVIGTTGIGADGLEEIRRLTGSANANAIVAPNFAIGAALMMRFAEQAARYFDAAEVIELHHDRKVDAPSGTAITTAQLIGAARDRMWEAPGGDGSHPGARGADVEGIRVHGVRLPGLLAHQEVIFGSAGQTLTVRHDTIDRSAFIPGVLLAIRSVADRPGLTVGLDALLD
ncbi:MAG TPA: 4-hydroxy-tetrahydrodipicolinate reductase [Actinomycetota bacterium]|nr:4-hydroxy-tetrahydrodipicolinate reductase [Actinomycetota bacterium]